MKAVTIRKAVKNDIPELAKQRRLMFEAMGHTDNSKLQSTSGLSKVFFLENMQNKKFHGWVAITEEGMIVSNAGVIIDFHPPGPNNPTGRIAYIFNLYTYPEFRRQGIARQIMETILEWVKEKEISTVSLNATDVGKELYESFGFKSSREMRLHIEKNKSKF